MEVINRGVYGSESTIRPIQNVNEDVNPTGTCEPKKTDSAMQAISEGFVYNYGAADNGNRISKRYKAETHVQV